MSITRFTEASIYSLWKDKVCFSVFIVVGRLRWLNTSFPFHFRRVVTIILPYIIFLSARLFDLTAKCILLPCRILKWEIKWDEGQFSYLKFPSCDFCSRETATENARRIFKMWNYNWMNVLLIFQLPKIMEFDKTVFFLLTQENSSSSI